MENPNVLFEDMDLHNTGSKFKYMIPILTVLYLDYGMHNMFRCFVLIKNLNHGRYYS